MIVRRLRMEGKSTKNNIKNKSGIQDLSLHLDLILDVLPIVLFSCNTEKEFIFYKGKGITKSLKRHEPKGLFELNSLISGAINYERNSTEGQVNKIINVGDDGEFLLSYQIVKSEDQKLNRISGYFIDQSKLTGSSTDKFKYDSRYSPYKEDFDNIRSEVYESYNEKLITSFHQTLESEIAIKMSKLIMGDN